MKWDKGRVNWHKLKKRHFRTFTSKMGCDMECETSNDPLAFCWENFKLVLQFLFIHPSLLGNWHISTISKGRFRELWKYLPKTRMPQLPHNSLAQNCKHTNCSAECKQSMCKRKKKLNGYNWTNSTMNFTAHF